jgi:hypothetical protein
MNSVYGIDSKKATTADEQPPRLRAIIEFIEGDLNRAPVVYPDAGSDAADESLRHEIQRRWSTR